MFFSLESLTHSVTMCLYCVKFSPSWWFEFLFNCWSKQLQTGPSSSGLIQIDGFWGPPISRWSQLHNHFQGGQQIVPTIATHSKLKRALTVAVGSHLEQKHIL